MTMWLTISSPLIFEQNFYVSAKRQKYLFAYLELNNFVVWQWPIKAHHYTRKFESTFENVIE